MATSKAKVAAWSIVLALLALPLTLKPPPEPGSDFRTEFHTLIGELGYLDNTDSPLFWILAEEPGRLFDEGQIRQSRPAFVMFGVVTRFIVSPFVEPSDDDPRAPARIGYTVLNVVLLATTIGLMISLLRGVGLPPTLIAAGVAVVVVNLVTRTFYWTAHTQILSLMAGVVLVFVAFHALSGARSWRWRVLTAFGLGLMCLASGTFFVALPSLWVTGEVTRRRRSTPFTWSKAWGEVLLGLVFLAPVILWVATITLVSGSFYSHETSAYRQFVWILDAMKEGQGQLGARTIEFLGAFIETLTTPEIAPFLILALFAASSFLARGRRIERDTETLDLQLASLITIGLLLLFLALLGYYRVRLTFSIVPPIAILFLAEIKARSWADEMVTRLLVGGATVVWVTAHLIRSVPYQ